MHARLTAKEGRYLARARVCRVASIDRRGLTHVAPLCHAFDESNQTVYVWTGGRTAQNLRQRPIYKDDDIDQVICLRVERAKSWGL